MITYSFKCKNCNEVKEIEVPTWDITGNRGIVNQEKLLERINEPRTCECGGELKRIMDLPEKSLLFEYVTVGKVSRRFK